MLETRSYGLAQRADRLLRLPVRTLVLARRLRDMYRLAAATNALRLHFPDEPVDTFEDWGGMLWRLCGLSGSLFDVDWLTLEYLDEGYMQTGDEEDGIESGYLEALAHFVEYIPVRFYQPEEEFGWWNDIPESVPVLAIIRGLTDPDYQRNISELLIEFELWDLPQLDASTLAALPERCAGQPEPLRWLAEVVDFCRKRTGNALLDRPSGTEEWAFQTEWRWDRPEDMEAVRRLSAEALAAWERIEKFIEYCDNQDSIERAVGLLIGLEVMDVEE